jgi:hypothetical protein
MLLILNFSLNLRFYRAICIGYCLSKIFNGTKFSKNLKFKEKFSINNIRKIIYNFFLNLIKNWFVKMYEKFTELINSNKKGMVAVKIVKKKFKSVFKFKRNFRLLKHLFLIYWEIIRISFSFANEIIFIKNIVNWSMTFIKFSRKKSILSLFIDKIVYSLYVNNIVNWPFKLMNFIKFLMKESVVFYTLIDTSAYFFYLIIIGIFGIIVGVLIGLYKPENEISPLIFLLLLIIINNECDNILLEYLPLETNKTQPFFKFSSKIVKQIESRPLKITLKKTEQILLPFSIVEDPLVIIDQKVLWHESPDYQFKLFKFYQHVNQNI